MNCKQIIAFIRPELLESVEQVLQAAGVPGLSSSTVRGYGEYADLSSADWMDSHIRLELFVSADRADEICALIMEHAHSGLAGDGIVAVQPVETLYNIRTRRPVEADGK